MIVLEVRGIIYTSFDEIEVARSLETLSGSFKFTAYTDSKDAFPFNVGDACRVFASGKGIGLDETPAGQSRFGGQLAQGVPLITGFIDKMVVSYSGRNHSVKITGRDKTSDIVDSTLGGLDLEGARTLQQIIKGALEAAGITGIEVFDQLPLPPKGLPPGEKVSAKFGTRVFDFIETYARKFQTLVTTDGRGNLVLTRADDRPTRFTLYNTFTNPDSNNIKQATITSDISKRFRKYVVGSQGNASSGGNISKATPEELAADLQNTATSSLKEMVEATNFALDDDMRESRTLHIVAESATPTEDCKPRADWQANVNRARSFTYKVTVEGFIHQPTGRVWNLNELVDVQDVFSDIKEPMLIASVKYMLSLKGGSETQLTLMPQDAYSLIASEPVLKKANSSANISKNSGLSTERSNP